MRIIVRPHLQSQQDMSLVEVNARLASGEFHGDEPAWTPGLSNWTILRNIAGVILPEPPPISQCAVGSSDSAQFAAIQASRGSSEGANFEKLHPWRRFFARSVDVTSSGVLLFMIAGVIVGVFLPDNAVDAFLKLMESQILVGVYIYVLWIPAEAMFLAVSGTTPAKWVFGIRVLDANGLRMSFGVSLKRAILVWAQGDGFGVPFITLFTRIFAYSRLKSTGTTRWDTSVNSVVVHKHWGVMRTIVCFLVVAGLLALYAWARSIPIPSDS